MVVTQQDIDNFHEFASKQLANHRGELTLLTLIESWQLSREREQANSAIREALADVDAGRIASADETLHSLYRKLDTPAP